ncbi:MAG: hypothetical protein SWK76_17080 [Actinomycetota bacterium]|nr:hypothetical protein [Actinomycetota bacterium]
MLLADKIQGHLLASEELKLYAKRYMQIIKYIPIIEVTNVTRYMYEQTTQEEWGLEDFPNIAPPFPIYFMETRAPKYSLSEDYGLVRQSGFPSRWGALFIALNPTREECNRFKIGEVPKQAKWILWALFFSEEDNGKVGLSEVEVGYLVNRDGEVEKIESGNIDKRYGDFPWLKIMASTTSMAEYFKQDEMLDQLSRTAAIFLNPLLLGTSFLHCKNVELHKINPPAKLSHKHKKKHGIYLCHYHVLKIEPMKAVLRSEGEAEKSGLRNALHICRGHFKDYRDKGLFGQHKGIYWWESHLRGNKKEGVVFKDYKIIERAE